MFHVIIDSAIDLPEGSTFDDFSLVPLYVKIDTQYYKDVVDISRDEFFRILPNEYDRISTSQPNMEDFLAAINSSKHEDVLVMTISSKISGTYNSALSAAQESDKKNVVVLDTWNLSMGAGVLALMALNMRNQGLPLEDVVNKLYELRERTRFWAVIATLKNLMRIGRISRFTGLVGEILRVKPVVELNPGTSFSPSLWQAFTVAHIEFGLPIEELFFASTVYAAKALGLNDMGAIVPGNKADLVVLNVPSLDWLGYLHGINPVDMVFKNVSPVQ